MSRMSQDKPKDGGPPLPRPPMRTLLLAAAAAAALASPAAAHAGDYGYRYDYAPHVAHDGFTLFGARAGVTVLGVNVDAGTGLRVSAGGYGGGYAHRGYGYAGGYGGDYGYAPPPPPPQVVAPPPAYETGYMGGYEGYGYAPQPPMSYPVESYGQPCGCGGGW